MQDSNASVLDRAAARTGTTLVVGPAGVGKTALVTTWAASAARSFPDGQLYVDLRGFSDQPPLPAEQALRVLLRSLGVRPDDIPDEPAAAGSLLRSRTAGRAMLIVLDNAREAAQVWPLLPGDGPTTIVTSRDQLRGLVAGGAATRVTLRPLPEDDSLELLAGHLGPERLLREHRQARLLTEAREHLPLALHVVGERLSRVPSLPARLLVWEMRRGDAPDPALRRALSWSFEALGWEARHTLHLAAALHPGEELWPESVAALTGLPVDRALEHLDRLTEIHLAEQTGPRRYRLPGLVRAVAARELAREDSAVVRRSPRDDLAVVRGSSREDSAVARGLPREHSAVVRGAACEDLSAVQGLWRGDASAAWGPQGEDQGAAREPVRGDRVAARGLSRGDAAAEIDAAVAGLLSWLSQGLTAAAEALAPRPAASPRPGSGPLIDLAFFTGRAEALRWYAEHRDLLAAAPAWARQHGRPEEATHLAALTRTVLARAGAPSPALPRFAATTART